MQGDHVIAYTIGKFGPAERNYTTGEDEPRESLMPCKNGDALSKAQMQFWSQTSPFCECNPTCLGAKLDGSGIYPASIIHGSIDQAETMLLILSAEPEPILRRIVLVCHW